MKKVYLVKVIDWAGEEVSLMDSYEEACFKADCARLEGSSVSIEETWTRKV